MSVHGHAARANFDCEVGLHVRDHYVAGASVELQADRFEVGNLNAAGAHFHVYFFEAGGEGYVGIGALPAAEEPTHAQLHMDGEGFAVAFHQQIWRLFAGGCVCRWRLALGSLPEHELARGVVQVHTRDPVHVEPRGSPRAGSVRVLTPLRARRFPRLSCLVACLPGGIAVRAPLFVALPRAVALLARVIRHRRPVRC